MFVKWQQVTDHLFKTRRASLENILAVRSQLPQSCKMQSIYSSLHGEVLSSMCGNIANVDNVMGLFVI